MKDPTELFRSIVLKKSDIPILLKIEGNKLIATDRSRLAVLETDCTLSTLHSHLSGEGFYQAAGKAWVKTAYDGHFPDYNRVLVKDASHKEEIYPIPDIKAKGEVGIAIRSRVIPFGFKSWPDEPVISVNFLSDIREWVEESNDPYVLFEKKNYPVQFEMVHPKWGKLTYAVMPMTK